ncbi:MAG: hypothetical protein ACJA0U_001010 [Salibacteraceae bacterium]|jgi:hypothetical protein
MSLRQGIRGNAADVVIGDTQGMFVQSLNITLNGDYNDPDDYDLDLNNDGLADITFRSIVMGSPQLGTSPRSFIRSLHANASMWMESFADTTFLINGTSTLVNNGYVWFIESATHSCTQLNPSDSVLEINENAFVMPVDAGYTLIYGSDFVSTLDYQPFIRNNFSGELNQVSSNADTIFYTSDSSFNECRLFPQGTYEYIGVKLKVNGNDKLGWIKFKITGDKIISIVESAILN